VCSLGEAWSVLVVEDDEAICELVEEILTEEGYEVRCAQDGRHALRLVEERPPGVILFDLAMPDMGGEGFIAMYRSLPNADAALIVVSGAHDLVDVAARIRADDYLTKPFDIDQLLGVVTRFAPASARTTLMNALLVGQQSPG
jgi:DNA-binding response OmpR family regulator